MPFGLFSFRLLYGNVDRSETFLALLNVKSYPVALIEGLETGCIDAGMMNEYIVTIFLLDEAVAFSVVKPFYDSISHCDVLLSKILIFLLWVATLTNGYAYGKKLSCIFIEAGFY